MMSALLEEGPKLFMLELVLHLADIGNPYKPFVICARGAELICEVRRLSFCYVVCVLLVFLFQKQHI